jgi:outer membrane protein insertion porin family
LIWATCTGVLAVLFLGGCTGLKHVESSDPLYTGAKIIFPQHEKSALPRDLKYELTEVINPKPNGKFLWMRPRLAIYNLMGDPKKEKGIGSWIKRKIGKPPVRLSDASPASITPVLENRLFNYGYFNSSADFTIDQNKKLAGIKYHVLPKLNYVIDSLAFPEKVRPINSIIADSQEGTLIKRDDPYRLATLESELERIEGILKDSGYYYFDRNYLKFKADTASKNHQIDLSLFLKPDLPSNSERQMKIGDIVVYDEYTLEDYHPDTVHMDGITYLTGSFRTRPEIITNQIFMLPGDLYSRSKHFRTLNHLTGLGIYKLVNVNFIPDSSSNRLQPNFFLTLQPKNSLSAELNAVVRTTNYTGPGINLSWKNRNIFHGAEIFSMNFNGSFEFQIGADSINTSLELGLDAGLEIPRVVPFRLKKLSPEFIPVTDIRMGTKMYRRVELYTMVSSFGQFGYRWRQSTFSSHELQLIDVSFTRVSDQTEAFREYLEANPIVKRSFEEQFIVGSGYSFIFDNRPQNKINSIYINPSFELAGNILSLFYNSIKGKVKQTGDQHKLFGVPYSQFIKFRTEFRNYYKIGKNTMLVTRGVIGVGIPYGNSEVIPYIRQFFAGGTNDLRAFVSRTVGPGSFIPTVNNLGVDQTGDIKLAANVEYRFSFTRLLKGAFFVDAGNVWLKNEDPERPGASFQWNRFYKEIALGTGFGLRFDADFVVVRFDFAWPVFSPNLPEGEKWVITDFNPINANWRRENLLFNFAIGYPF